MWRQKTASPDWPVNDGITWWVMKVTLSGKGRKKKKKKKKRRTSISETLQRGKWLHKNKHRGPRVWNPHHNGAKGILSPLSPPLLCRVCVIYINSVAEFRTRCYNDHHTAMALNCNGKKPHQNRVEWSQVGTCGKKAHSVTKIHHKMPSFKMWLQKIMGDVMVAMLILSRILGGSGLFWSISEVFKLLDGQKFSLPGHGKG